MLSDYPPVTDVSVLMHFASESSDAMARYNALIQARALECEPVSSGLTFEGKYI